MKLVAIYGSPRKGGNTEVIADMLINELNKGLDLEIERFYIRDMKISGCIECYGCEETGSCVLEDDMQAIYEALEGADLLIFSAPIFFYSFNAQAKAVIDRIQAFWVRKYILKKSPEKKVKGILVSAGGTKGKKLFDGALLTFKYFMDSMDGEVLYNLTFRGLDKKGDAEKNREVREKTEKAAEEILKLL